MGVGATGVGATGVGATGVGATGVGVGVGATTLSKFPKKNQVSVSILTKVPFEYCPSKDLISDLL